MGYVYLRHDPGNKAYKIGYTTSSSQRASAYRTENPHMTLVYEYESCRHTCAELALRDRLKRLKQPYGKDWFKEDKFVVWTFEQVRAEFSDEPELVAKRATATAEERRRAQAVLDANARRDAEDRKFKRERDARLAAEQIAKQELAMLKRQEALENCLPDARRTILARLENERQEGLFGYALSTPFLIMLLGSQDYSRLNSVSGFAFLAIVAFISWVVLSNLINWIGMQICPVYLNYEHDLEAACLAERNRNTLETNHYYNKGYH